MSLTTRDKIRTLQRKLYCEAKAEPAYRFYVLYDKICREDILRHAYGLARANAGAPGADGVSFEQVEERGLEAWLAGLRRSESRGPGWLECRARAPTGAVPSRPRSKPRGQTHQ
jgi:hypothetical protein